MERSYIDELNQTYDEFFSKPYNGTPVLTIETNDLDFVRKPEDLKLIEGRIREALEMAPFQPELLD